MAGMGWLVFQGGVGLVAGTPITLSALGALTAPAILLKGAVAVAFVSSIVVAQRRSKSGLILPLASLLALLLFNVVIHGIGPDVLHASGWLVPLPGGQGLWPPISASDLARVDWSELLVGMIAFPGIASMTVMALLMNASGIIVVDQTRPSP
jgi:hypothetical protein